MITSLYVIYDSKAQFYNKPFSQLNDEIALRTAQQMRNDENSELYRNPADFTLFKIGQYDDESAQIDTLAKHTVICRFHEIPVIEFTNKIPKTDAEILKAVNQHQAKQTG